MSPTYYATDTWSRWATSNATTITSATDTWGYWNAATSGTSTTNTVWLDWNGDGAAAPARIVRSAAAIAADDARRKEWNAQEAAHVKLREAAKARAEKLLVENLSPIQRAQFSKERCFVVDGRNGLRYRIRQGRSGNIDMVKADGTIQHRLCAHPREDVPDFDTMLAQKLMLEHDEDSFINLANRHHVLNPGARVLEALH